MPTNNPADWTPGPGYAKIIELMRQADEQAERDRNTQATVPIPKSPADDPASDDDPDG